MTQQLPIIEIIPQIKEKLRFINTLILQAPPGAGKSTILPLHLIDEPWLMGKKIVMLEPRRLAAQSVAHRMSALLNEPVGKTVGYRVRFENRVSLQTRIEVLTEGILTRMLQQDNSLEDVGLIIFDEFHERSLQADLALALSREMQQVLREDLRIMIMSATLDGDQLSILLGGAPILSSQGRQYPIQFHYSGQDDKVPVSIQMSRAIRRAFSQHEGDILAFLPGAGEIEKTNTILEAELKEASVHPLYGDLPQQKQQQAILPHPSGKRKVVLSTSIAETSLTIEGIKVVIDSGYARSPRFDPKTGLTRLETSRVTKDAADQRAGRAGRLGPGICYRLWNEGFHQHLVPHRTPEILEADLAPLVLELSQWGIQDINNLTWLTPPPSGAINQARELLRQLEALDGDRITERGKAMLRLPTHPRIAHLLLEGQEKDLIALGSDVAAILEERDPLPKETGANLAERVEVLRKWRSKAYVSANINSLDRIERLASSWRKAFKIDMDNSFPNYEDVGKLLAAAYPERVAKQREPNSVRYRLTNGRTVKLREHDPLINETWLAVAHMDAGTNEGSIYLAAPLNVKDILHLSHQVRTVSWDSQKGQLIARTETRLGDIIIESKPLQEIPEEERLKILCEVIRKEGFSVLPINESITQWQARVSSLRVWRSHEDWPDISNIHLLETLEDWLAPFLTNIRKQDDFQKIDLLSIMANILPWELNQKLETLAPSKIKVPSGSMIQLNYNPDGGIPVLAVRLQEVFGLLDTPTINEGRNQVLLHLLSPGYKPVQVTQDLKSFWKNTYPDVRKQLRVRYQKHHWPEDPWTAEAVRGIKKKS